jgi:hypothetical protein
VAARAAPKRRHAEEPTPPCRALRSREQRKGAGQGCHCCLRRRRHRSGGCGRPGGQGSRARGDAQLHVPGRSLGTRMGGARQFDVRRLGHGGFPGRARRDAGRDPPAQGRWAGRHPRGRGSVRTDRCAGRHDALGHGRDAGFHAGTATTGGACANARFAAVLPGRGHQRPRQGYGAQAGCRAHESRSLASPDGAGGAGGRARHPRWRVERFSRSRRLFGRMPAGRGTGLRRQDADPPGPDRGRAGGILAIDRRGGGGRDASSRPSPTRQMPAGASSRSMDGWWKGCIWSRQTRYWAKWEADLGKVQGLTIVPRGRHVIRAGVVSDKPTAFVFLGRQRIKDLVFSRTTVEEAINAASAWISTQTADMIKSRRAPHVASQREYEEFLATSELSDHETEMLRFHARNASATMGQIAGALGWDYSAGNLHYGQLGMKVANELGLSPRTRADGTKIGISSIGDDGPRGEDGNYVLAMHPELRAALQSAGLC